MDRITQEIELLRRFYPDLEYVGEGRWVLLSQLPVPAEPGWSSQRIDVAVQFPPGYPAQKPYGFHVRPVLSLASGAEVQNVTASSDPPWPGPWQKFSWDAPAWFASSDVKEGSNMLNYVLTFVDRLRMGA
jgi:hypothetical protein